MTARRLAAVACTAVSLAAFAAEPPAVVTLIESGGGALFRGTSRYVLQEGVRLQTGDIIEIGDKGVVEMEFADGVRLSLGPRARFYIGLLAPRGPKGPGLSDFYLMAGWTKFAAGKSAAPFRYTTPLFGLGTTEAIAVLQVTGAEGAMFVETGDVRVAEGFAKALRDSPVRLRGGQFYSRKPDQRGTIQQRPAPAFVAAMPRHYMDNLPTRLSRFKDREVPPRPAGELSYADVELWLKAPREIRRPVMQRFVRKADDPEFRRGLVANLRFHPEWDPILFPEKYEPKEPQPTALHPQPAPPQAGAPGPAATQ